MNSNCNYSDMFLNLYFMSINRSERLSDKKMYVFVCMFLDLVTSRFTSNNLGHLSGPVVKHPTSAHVIISPFVGLSPTLGSVLTAQSLEPASGSLSPSLSLSLYPSPSRTLSLSKKTLKKFF